MDLESSGCASLLSSLEEEQIFDGFAQKLCCQEDVLLIPSRQLTLFVGIHFTCGTLTFASERTSLLISQSSNDWGHSLGVFFGNAFCCIFLVEFIMNI
ncbi:unnamed protein product [Moneuplotes crassus]|uniref:Uncharacterized protein n=1 Tax=Euplotes crassus TaxID=5936 RepID=A0AAD2DAD2_EUPCR|nr:unnamed protein product [Moneuplotes crassus]